MEVTTEHQEQTSRPEYLDILEKYRSGCIIHVLGKVLGIPLPELYRYVGYSYKKFLREYRYSLEIDYHSELIGEISTATGGLLDPITAGNLSVDRLGDKYILYPVGFGEKYAEENTVEITPPVDIVDAILSYKMPHVLLLRDSEDREIYITISGFQPRIYTSPPPVLDEIAPRIKKELETLQNLWEPPFAVEKPDEPFEFEVRKVSVKTESFAYYHRRKHGKTMKPGTTSLDIPLIVTDKGVHYVLHSYWRVENILMYYIFYPVPIGVELLKNY